MSNFSVNTTSYLRNFYSPYRALITESAREQVSSSKLSEADSNALKQAIRALEDYNYMKDEDDVTTAEKTRFDRELRAFIDTYNYSIESSSNSSNRSIKKAGEGLKKLAEEYADELKDVGITVKKTGYLNLSSSATTNLRLSTFGDMFSSSSKFLKKANEYAGKIYRHIDAYA